MPFVGNGLKECNEEIIKCITELQSQRDDLELLIQKQLEEKERLQVEVERITYKLAMLDKSLNQRMITKANYDKAIVKAQNGYTKLLKTTEVLLSTVSTDVHNLEEIMDKRTSTESDPRFAKHKVNTDLEEMTSCSSENKLCTEFRNIRPSI